MIAKALRWMMATAMAMARSVAAWLKGLTMDADSVLATATGPGSGPMPALPPAELDMPSQEMAKEKTGSRGSVRAFV